jgi:hypothetical protein
MGWIAFPNIPEKGSPIVTAGKCLHSSINVSKHLIYAIFDTAIATCSLE